jgi:hypothetical protein
MESECQVGGEGVRGQGFVGGSWTGLALMRSESEDDVLSNYVEGLAASGTEAEHGEVIVE